MAAKAEYQNRILRLELDLQAPPSPSSPLAPNPWGCSPHRDPHCDAPRGESGISHGIPTPEPLRGQTPGALTAPGAHTRHNRDRYLG